MPTGGQLLSLYYGAYFTLFVSALVIEMHGNQQHGHSHRHTFAKLPLTGMALGFWPLLLLALVVYAVCSCFSRQPRG